jgi:hypothetical protein
VIVYISIGNSDDKLTQRQWSDFVLVVDHALNGAVNRGHAALHGSWRSPSDAPWQNACWCIEFEAGLVAVGPLRELLAGVASDFHQDSIAWTEVKTTEFLGVRS